LTRRQLASSKVQAVSPCGSGNPFARQVAVSVLASKQAIVIGPTPRPVPALSLLYGRDVRMRTL
jgi:hypothetical protein